MPPSWADVERVDPAALLESWIDDAKAQGCSHVLVSSEELCRLDLERDAFGTLRKVLSQFDTGVLGYVRSPLRFVLSRYRHEVQNGGEVRSVSDFVRSEEQLVSSDFDRRTAVWSEAFGPRASFFRYESSLSGGDVVPHFFSRIGCANLDLSVARRGAHLRASQSLHPLLIDLRRYVTLACPSSECCDLPDLVWSLSRKIDALVPAALSLESLLSNCVLARVMGQELPPMAPIIQAILESTGSEKVKHALLSEVARVWGVVKRFALPQNGGRILQLYPPQATAAELYSLYESRFGR